MFLWGFIVLSRDSSLFSVFSAHTVLQLSIQFIFYYNNHITQINSLFVLLIWSLMNLSITWTQFINNYQRSTLGGPMTKWFVKISLLILSWWCFSCLHIQRIGIQYCIHTIYIWSVVLKNNSLGTVDIIFINKLQFLFFFIFLIYGTYSSAWTVCFHVIPYEIWK